MRRFWSIPSPFPSTRGIGDDFGDGFRDFRLLFRPRIVSDSKNDSERENSHSPSHFGLKMTQTVTQNANSVIIPVIWGLRSAKAMEYTPNCSKCERFHCFHGVLGIFRFTKPEADGIITKLP